MEALLYLLIKIWNMLTNGPKHSRGSEKKIRVNILPCRVIHDNKHPEKQLQREGRLRHRYRAFEGWFWRSHHHHLRLLFLADGRVRLFTVFPLCDTLRTLAVAVLQIETGGERAAVWNQPKQNRRESKSFVSYRPSSCVCVAVSTALAGAYKTGTKQRSPKK